MTSGEGLSLNKVPDWDGSSNTTASVLPVKPTDVTIPAVGGLREEVWGQTLSQAGMNYFRKTSPALCCWSLSGPCAAAQQKSPVTTSSPPHPYPSHPHPLVKTHSSRFLACIWGRGRLPFTKPWGCASGTQPELPACINRAEPEDRIRPGGAGVSQLCWAFGPRKL